MALGFISIRVVPSYRIDHAMDLGLGSGMGYVRVKKKYVNQPILF